MPVEIYDFYPRRTTPPPPPASSSSSLQFMRHCVGMHDMIYSMTCSLCLLQTGPPGIGVAVINSDINFKCHMFFRSAKRLVIPVMTRHS